MMNDRPATSQAMLGSPRHKYHKHKSLRGLLAGCATHLHALYM